MGIVYHGSKTHGIKRLETHRAYHGDYLYATNDKTVALIMSGRAGDDLVYKIGRYNKNEPYEIVELVPGALDKIYSNSSSIYTIPDDTFKDIHTGFEEVVSEEGVDVLGEEFIDNVYDALLKEQEKGLVKIYRYPNKPNDMENDYVIDKVKKGHQYNSEMYNSIRDFDKLFMLHPHLLNEINDMLLEFYGNGDEEKRESVLQYKVNDLVLIFDMFIQQQLHDMERECYIESAYIMINKTYPELKEQIEPLYRDYLEKKENTVQNNNESKGRSVELDNFIIKTDMDIPYFDDIVNQVKTTEVELMEFFGIKEFNPKITIEVLPYMQFRNWIFHKYKNIAGFCRADQDKDTNTIRLLNLDDQLGFTNHKDTNLDEFLKTTSHEMVHAFDPSKTLWFREGLATNLSHQDYECVDLSNCDFDKLVNKWHEYNKYVFAYTIVNYILNNYSHEEVMKMDMDSDYLASKSDEIFKNAIDINSKNRYN